MRRSAAEIRFRLQQEFFNAWYLGGPPLFGGLLPQPARLPDAAAIAGRLRGSSYAAEIVCVAEKLLRHEFPLLGIEIHTGPEIRWRRDYVHGRESPPSYFRFIPYLDTRRVGDHKIIWELNRHQHLVLLAQAWRLTGRPAFLADLASQLDSWLEQNPFQRGINWTSALEVAFRALSWIWIDHLAGASLPVSLRSRFATALYQHGAHLERNLSVYFSPNTHLLGEAVALHALGAVYPAFPRSARWVQIGHSVVEAEIQHQVHDDGSHFEQSTYYHVYALDMFLFHAILAPVSAAYTGRLRAMAGYLDALLGPGRRLPFIGDDDGGRFFHPFGPRDRFGCATMATASILLNGSWECSTPDVEEQAVWWLGEPAFDTSPRSDASAVSSWFADARMAVLAAEEVRIYIDAGEFGPGSGGHSHSDALSLIVRNGDTELLIDPGTYTYVADPEWRNRFRGCGAHNTIRIDQKDQAIPLGPFAWADKPATEVIQRSYGTANDLLEARCRYRGLTHTRRVQFSKPDTIEIVDQLDGPAGQEHLIEQYWHPGGAVERLSNERFRIAGNAILQLDAAFNLSLQEQGEFGWRSPAFGLKVPAEVICGSCRATFPVRFRSVLTLRHQS